MKYVFKGFFGARIKGLLIYVPLTFFIGGIIWFFVHVLFGGDTGFLETWRNTYIIINIADFFIACLGILARIGYSLYYSHKFQASFGDVAEALVKHNLLKRKQLPDMTGDDFRKFLSISRAAHDIAESMVKMIIKSRYE